MLIGTGHTVRECCDGQSASRGRAGDQQALHTSDQYGTLELLIDLALGQVEGCPMAAKDVQERKSEVVGRT